MTTFTQLTERLKNFLMGWLLVLGLKESVVECATVCVKSEVILTYNTTTINTATITKNFYCYCCFLRNLAKIDWSRPPKSIYKLAVSFRGQDFVYGPYDEQTVLSWWGPSWLVMFVWGGKGPEAVSFIMTNVFFHIK